MSPIPSEDTCFNSNAGGACVFEPAFESIALRLRFIARESLHFPAGESANLLRGWLGKALMKASAADYGRLFAPRRQHGPSGLRDAPRPFVLRVAHLEGAHVPAGGRFEIGVNLFDTRAAAVDSISAAMSAAVRTAVRSDPIEEPAARPLRLSLRPYARPVQSIRVRFVTPTELKSAFLTSGPEFRVLFARIRDRVSTLRSLYGAGPLPIDFQGMGRRAETVRTMRSDLRCVEARRLSRNTGLQHPLGGFVGLAEYAGDLAEFVPYLEAARWTGVGRQTVWGKGEINWEEI